MILYSTKFVNGVYLGGVVIALANNRRDARRLMVKACKEDGNVRLCDGFDSRKHMVVHQPGLSGVEGAWVLWDGDY